MRLDSKVHGTLIKNKNGKEIPEDEFVVFRPGDDALPETLVFYRDLIVKQGAGKEQVQAVLDLEIRVGLWRRLHPSRCKVADVEPGELQT